MTDKLDFRVIHGGDAGVARTPAENAALLDRLNAAISAGLGWIVTDEGFTIRDTRDILFGDPDADPSRAFDGLETRVMRGDP